MLLSFVSFSLSFFFFFFVVHVDPQGSVWPDKPRTRFPCLEPSTGRVKNVLLPPLLLETAIALLSFHREDAKPTPELKARARTVSMFHRCA